MDYLTISMVSLVDGEFIPQSLFDLNTTPHEFWYSLERWNQMELHSSIVNPYEFSPVQQNPNFNIGFDMIVT